ncbi:hypothetical protein [Burkholderia stagnalis]|uniref:hypothetical protein n=1 Tax=Burkholderia TaxID=32008 RepID=UPI00075DC81B|nr:hypothetical protein [Burkholderia stagnalis]KVL90153.1 hypothetical protein WT02_24565 [Burkholderia stagnalis]KVL95485.1 hypothetical protein WT03_12980 [Burkholderia stagnalis]KVM14535.1 hypothetical protein WT04_08170 [Burkholderia stagnalis]
MDSLSSYAVDPVSAQLMLLNVLLAVYLICKAVDYVTRIVSRRDPPKKSIRSKVAHSEES